jgi:NAD(P)-dependent dehydrogenase (short-subunit alcohol dehydrogenase family)
MGEFFDLTNMTAVLIGGTSGIGLATSKALARAGANVVLSGRRSAQVGAIHPIEALGSESLAQTDVTDSLEHLLNAACNKFGRLECHIGRRQRSRSRISLAHSEAAFRKFRERQSSWRRKP